MKRTKYKTSTQIAKEQPPLTAEEESLEQLMLEDAGKGISHELIDNLWWFDEREEVMLRRPWLKAISAVDRIMRAKGIARRKDRKELVALLKSGEEIMPAERVYLADLLDRYDFRRPKAPPMVPKYDLTAKAQAQMVCEQRVRELMKYGPGPKAQRMTLEAALAYLLRHKLPRGVDLTALKARLEGKHASARRAKNGRPKI